LSPRWGRFFGSPEPRNVYTGWHWRLAGARPVQPDLLPKLSNEIVFEFSGERRSIARNGVYTHALTSTLIEACASQRRGFAISNEEHPDV
jgi:hypothetical protein